MAFFYILMSGRGGCGIQAWHGERRQLHGRGFRKVCRW